MVRDTLFKVKIGTAFGELNVLVEGPANLTDSELDAKAIELIREAVPFFRYEGSEEVFGNIIKG